MNLVFTSRGGIFQAPTCRSLGLRLQMRLRNTTRRLGSGSTQQAAEPLRVDLRVFRRGELVYCRPAFGDIPPGGTLVVRETDVDLTPGSQGEHGEDEDLFVAKMYKPSAAETFLSQEHQIVYTHPASGGQAHLLYDQQPLRSPSSRATPIVLLMPKIWIGDDINTHVLVCNTWAVDAVARQPEPFQFSLLEEGGEVVCSWEERFFYNQASALDMRARLLASGAGKHSVARFLNLVGRGGASSFVLFAVVANSKLGHFAVEHSLPPVYYMDGPMARVRAEGCDVRLFRERTTHA